MHPGTVAAIQGYRRGAVLEYLYPATRSQSCDRHVLVVGQHRQVTGLHTAACLAEHPEPVDQAPRIADAAHDRDPLALGQRLVHRGHTA